MELLGYKHGIEKIKNLVVKDALPEGVTYESASIEIRNIHDSQDDITHTISYNETSRVVNFVIGNIEPSNVIVIKIKVTADPLAENIQSKQIHNNIVAVYDYERKDETSNEVLESLSKQQAASNVINTIIEKSNLSITKQTQNINEVNNVGDKVKFIINIKNIGEVKSEQTTIKSDLPNEIIPQELKYGKLGELIYRSYRNRNISLEVPELEPNEEYLFEITGKIGMDENYEDEYQKTEISAKIGEDTVTWNINVINQNKEEEEPTPTPSTDPTPTPSTDPTPTPSTDPTPTPSTDPTPTPSIDPTPTPTKDTDEKKENTVFDMALNKTVNKVVVQTSDETKSYNFGKDTAKIDIDSKYINGATVLVEYKFTIKNEGELNGTVKSIVDYMPKEMSFSTNINKSWVQGADGNLYNSELKNIPIGPGETKEILLVLTKNMTEDNVGLIKNTAELAVVENSDNISDIDSTPANKESKEDDISSADVLIGIRTGDETTYIAITAIVLIIILIGIYLIKRNVLKGIKEGGDI